MSSHDIPRDDAKEPPSARRGEDPNEGDSGHQVESFTNPSGGLY
jgi:hypothetical protein